MIRPVQPEDAAAICGIYNHYIEHTTITFEETPLNPEEMTVRIAEITAAFPWLVWADESGLLGYAYARPFHARSAYRYTVESAIYLRHNVQGRGIGTRLYGELIRLLDNQGYHTLIGSIALPNDASVRLHEKCGFTKAGHLGEVGWKFGRWIDVGFWQRTTTSD